MRETFFRDLSGGQKQRLSIALALIGRPTIAVLDELTTGLDPQARRDTWDLVKAVRDRGVTTLLVTHDMEEAQHLCDRVALVDAGRIVAIDTPARLAERTAGGKRVRFRPSAAFDESLLTRLPEVSSLEHDRGLVVVTGEGDLANAVILTLAKVGVSARDLAMESGALEDAFLALTGRGIGKADHEASQAEGVVPRDREHRAFRGWRAAIRRHGPSGPPPPLAAFGRLVANEWHLTLRNPAALVWGVGFPILLLAIFGSLPATTKPDAALGGLSFFEVYLPVMIALSLGLLALIGLPVPITSYRERGVLRRMATTPVPPSWLLGAQVVVNLVLLLVAVLVVVLGGVALGAHLPLQTMGFVLSVLLAAGAMFALGLWVAAIARTQRAAGAIGAALFYPMLFFAGVWLPREVMPPALRTVSDLTPLGAAVHAMDISMLKGQFPPAESLLVMAAWAVIFGWLSVRMFRWE